MDQRTCSNFVQIHRFSILSAEEVHIKLQKQEINQYQLTFEYTAELNPITLKKVLEKGRITSALVMSSGLSRVLRTRPRNTINFRLMASSGVITQATSWPDRITCKEQPTPREWKLSVAISQEESVEC
jgi:hypothetical protein